MKTRRLRKQKRQAKKTRSRKQKGAGEWCYSKDKTWSCSAECGENGACEKLD